MAGHIDTGYFDPSKVKERAAAVNYKVKLQEQEVSFESAWRVYHDSFDNNEMEVLNSIYASFKRNVQSISPRNCSSTIALFKDLGRESEARELLQFFMSERREEPGFWDEAFAPGMETDPDVEAAFKERHASFQPERDFADLLMTVSPDRLFKDEIATLAAASPDAYYEAFKRNKGEQLSKLISGALQFDRIANASEEMRQISHKAKEALRRIGSESKINAARVRKFGIRVNN